jgi:hypothetical protein
VNLARKLRDCTPHIQAAIVIVALAILERLSFATPRKADVVRALGVSRSRAYELADRLAKLATTLTQPRGRPPNPEVEPPSDVMFQVAALVRDYLAEHPGAMSTGQRHTYTVGFRHFVLDLVAPDGLACELGLERTAMATGVPADTLKDWLRLPRPQKDVPTPDEDQPNDATGMLPEVIAQIVELYHRWKGDFTAFCRSLEEHRIEASTYLVRHILELTGQRRPGQPRRPKSDAEALRGELERFFPNAQVVADGKQVIVQLGDHRYVLCWELCVDADTGALTGISVRDAEDSQGLLEAVAHSEVTTGAAPEALLRDNLPANHSSQVENVLDNKGILGMPSTTYRPQNKASVEGAFGLFSQTMPDIQLPNGSVRELARRLLFFILFAYCAGRNHTPRPRLNNRSAAEAFAEDVPTPEERAAARRRLQEIKDRILARRNADQERTDPVCRKMLTEAFAELGLEDPEGHFVHAIARLGVDAALRALSIFKAKRRAGTLQVDCPERYLLGIAQNVAYQTETLAVYDELVRLRTNARDLLLRPLDDENERLQARFNTHDYLRATAHRALSAPARIDRFYWRQTTLDTFANLGPVRRHKTGAWLARRIATAHTIPRCERNDFIAALAAATTGAL